MTRQRNILYILTGVVVLFLITILVVVVLRVTSQTIIVIQNYPEKIKNLPDDFRDVIQNSLYHTVKKNSKTNSNLFFVSDAFIREGSENQTSRNDNSIFTGNFIVDIESIRQSYMITYNYSFLDKNSPDVYANVICLPKNKSKYKEFSCDDLLSDEAVDPITNILPHGTLDYNIDYKLTDGVYRNTNVTITVYLNTVDQKLNRDQIIAERVQQAKDYIKSYDIDIEKYYYTISINEP